jgi:hypothetical protein
LALYIPSKKALFVHVYKTGGQSIRHALLQSCGREAIEIHLSHSTAEEAIEMLYRGGMDVKHVFAFIREPYSWAVSQYNFIRKEPGHPSNAEVRSMDFCSFVIWLCDAVEKGRPWLSGKFCRQSDFILRSGPPSLKNKRLVNHLYRFEDLAGGWRSMRQILGYESNSPDELRILNASTEKHDAVSLFHKCESLDYFNRVFNQDFIEGGYNRL